jgi:HSP20 family protein
MLVRRYRPIFSDLPDFARPDLPARFSRTFEDFFGSGAPAETAMWMPDVDILEKEDELLLTAELPGLKLDQVQLDVSDGALTLKGEKREEKEDKDKRYRVWERTYGSFERTFALPRTVDPAKIQAEFEDGVLKVHLPKTAQAVGRRVEIKSTSK